MLKKTMLVGMFSLVVIFSKTGIAMDSQIQAQYLNEKTAVETKHRMEELQLQTKHRSEEAQLNVYHAQQNAQFNARWQAAGVSPGSVDTTLADDVKKRLDELRGQQDDNYTSELQKKIDQWKRDHNVQGLSQTEEQKQAEELRKALEQFQKDKDAEYAAQIQGQVDSWKKQHNIKGLSDADKSKAKEKIRSKLEEFKKKREDRK